MNTISSANDVCSSLKWPIHGFRALHKRIKAATSKEPVHFNFPVNLTTLRVIPDRNRNKFKIELISPK